MINLRRSLRQFDEMRDLSCELNFMPSADGSCLIKFGNTQVICSATIENNIPYFLRNTGKGWLTAEYFMLPTATNQRTIRESSKGKLDSRTHEIQRLIGRSLRAAVDFKKLGERQIIIDCDVIKADGGTRTAAITGGYIALYLALTKLLEKKIIKELPIKHIVAAISCGIVKDNPILDLEYVEDSEAEVDANFIMTDDNSLIEIQITAEKRPFTKIEYEALYELASKGIIQLVTFQKKMLKI